MLSSSALTVGEDTVTLLPGHVTNDYPLPTIWILGIELSSSGLHGRLSYCEIFLMYLNFISNYVYVCGEGVHTSAGVFDIRHGCG